MTNKPHSAACDNNSQPIFEVIEPLFSSSETVLEIGSGTGQHAVYFAEKMPHLVWQCSDLKANHAGIIEWLEDADLANTRAPIELDVSKDQWPLLKPDVVFSANAIHIMSWEAGKAMIAGVGALLPEKGLFLLYGPFNYNNAYISESNANFDVWLKQRDTLSGIRDFEKVEGLANDAGMELLNDYPMPVNNRILCWRKR
jgi:cyclopropane fatty-acyl-phospholipid synthase-like methyltransferase